jgi:GTP cyclohydrolase I
MTTTSECERVEKFTTSWRELSSPAPGVDTTRDAESAVAALLTALGRDVTQGSLIDTPRRVVESLRELLTPDEFTFTTFPNSDGYTELVLVRDIPFASLCEHHLLPFRGVAHVGYVPGASIAGLSALARSVDVLSRDLQLQERLTVQVARLLESKLSPRGVGVVLEAEHACMSLRGSKRAGTTTVTSAFFGELEHSDSLRARFFTGETKQG